MNKILLSALTGIALFPSSGAFAMLEGDCSAEVGTFIPPRRTAYMKVVASQSVKDAQGTFLVNVGDTRKCVTNRGRILAATAKSESWDMLFSDGTISPLAYEIPAHPYNTLAEIPLYYVTPLWAHVPGAEMTIPNVEGGHSYSFEVVEREIRFQKTKDQSIPNDTFAISSVRASESFNKEVGIRICGPNKYLEFGKQYSAVEERWGNKYYPLGEQNNLRMPLNTPDNILSEPRFRLAFENKNIRGCNLPSATVIKPDHAYTITLDIISDANQAGRLKGTINVIERSIDSLM